MIKDDPSLNFRHNRSRAYDAIIKDLLKRKVRVKTFVIESIIRWIIYAYTRYIAKRRRYLSAERVPCKIYIKICVFLAPPNPLKGGEFNYDNIVTFFQILPKE